MADVITPRRGGGSGGAMPHLDDGIVSEILYRLPSKDAYRLAAVCPQWRAVLDQPTFLGRHLMPRTLPLLDDRPYALIIQPRRKVGYFTHLTLVAVDPADPVPVNVPLQPKYMYSEPEPCLLDTASDDSVFNLLYCTGADDSAPIDDAELLASAPATTMIDVSAVDAVHAPPVGERVEDYVFFFERTIPMLGISIVASYGRLLLCQRRQSRYYLNLMWSRHREKRATVPNPWSGRVDLESGGKVYMGMRRVRADSRRAELPHLSPRGRQSWDDPPSWLQLSTLTPSFFLAAGQIK